MKKFLLIGLAFLVGCAHQIKFVDMEKGEILLGKYNSASKTVTVTLPDGEVLVGEYSTVQPGSVSFGSASGYGMAGHNLASFSSTGSAYSLGLSGQAYSILTGTKGTVMEMLVNFSGSSGFGEAVTNKKKVYKVQF